MVAYKDLVSVLKDDFGKDAEDYAKLILDFFGYEEKIIDSKSIESKDRDKLYDLEDKGYLKTEREDITLYDGKEWRIPYWILNKNKLNKNKINEQSKKIEKVEEKQDPYKIYDEISEDNWHHKESEEVEAVS